MLNTIKVTCVIIGTIIGAGFASGQEVLIFFNSYGIYGIIGLIISMALISIIVYKTLKVNFKSHINIYQEFIEYIIPQKLKKNKIVIYTISNIVNIFLLISFNIMVAGFATYFLQEFNIHKIIGSVVIAIVSFIIFTKGLNGILKINTILIPILLFLILYLGIKKINSFEIIEKNKSMYWIISCILYVSYNSISLIPILITMQRYIDTEKEISKISIYTFIILFFISLIIYLLINIYKKELQTVEIPIVYIAGKLGIIEKYIYGTLLLMAILTTAISSGYGFLNNIAKNNNYLKLCVVMCLVSIIFGQISFANLIGILYPVFGVLGIVQIFFLLTA